MIRIINIRLRFTIKTFIFFFFLSFCITNLVFSQATTNQEYYKFYDSVTMYENKGIFNGLQYIDKYKDLSSEDHKFYNSYSFLNGSLVYDGQPHFDIKMKYQLLDDILIIEFINKKKVNYMILNSNMVSKFRLDNNEFVKLANNKVLSPFYKNGFFEISYKNTNYTLYTKYIKKEIENIKYRKLYYTFDEDEVYVINYKNQFHVFNSKKDLIKIITEYEKEIKVFFKVNDKLYRTNKKQFIIKLLENLNNKTN